MSTDSHTMTTVSWMSSSDWHTHVCSSSTDSHRRKCGRAAAVFSLVMNSTYELFNDFVLIFLFLLSQVKAHFSYLSRFRVKISWKTVDMKPYKEVKQLCSTSCVTFLLCYLTKQEIKPTREGNWRENWGSNDSHAISVRSELNDSHLTKSG